MVPAAEGGPSTIENAIPLCFECHAEVHHYNDKHPKGRKFQPSELKLHKKQWLAFCKKNAGALAQMPNDASVGPLQALLDEMEFNVAVAIRTRPNELGCLLLDDQFRRALQLGALSILTDETRAALFEAYAWVGKVNQFLQGMHHHRHGSDAFNTSLNEAQKGLRDLSPDMQLARESLTKFLAVGN